MDGEKGNRRGSPVVVFVEPPTPTAEGHVAHKEGVEVFQVLGRLVASVTIEEFPDTDARKASARVRGGRWLYLK